MSPEERRLALLALSSASFLCPNELRSLCNLAMYSCCWVGAGGRDRVSPGAAISDAFNRGTQYHTMLGAVRIANTHLRSRRVVYPPFKLACPRTKRGLVVRRPKVAELRHDDAHGIFARLDSFLSLALPQCSLKKTTSVSRGDLLRKDPRERGVKEEGGERARRNKL